MEFDEYELLTLRQGLLVLKGKFISQEDFNKIDTKLKIMIEDLKC